MVITLDTLHARRTAILEVARRRGARNVRVFGSVARGDAQETSDLDLLVDMEPGRTLLDLSALERELSELLGCRVEVGTTVSPQVRARVLKEAVAL
ncbi:MAG TPA: nucleotidyltransferase family protein [Candidatus Dormibacteraeota bacterium]|jgi:predicted nucleotidyltransferase|nr:nucleotidyltransferase family protein [Candidatus Dormibacteraeota bacterium]